MRLAIIVAAALAMASPAMAQEPITAMHDGIAAPLAGTLEGELAQGEPAILIIPGSGPTDRHGNNPLGVNAQSYRLLAEALAERGIASVRIDKRGMFESAGAIADPNMVTVADYVADTEAWADAIEARIDADCTWLLGHSEGTLVAMAAAATTPERYCGLLLVAPVGRPLGATIREQLLRNPANAPIMPQVAAILAALENGERYEGEMHPGLVPLFGPQVQDFVISLLSYNPSELLQGHDLPVLVIGGREDLQTPDADALALALARPDARILLVEGMTHTLKQIAPGDAAANQASYTDPDLPIAPAVPDAIALFVTEKR